MKSKKGISLLVLTITIIVMIILASVVVVISANTTNNSKKAAFASDLEQIEDLVREFYLVNETLPIVTGGTEYSKTTFTNLITNGKSSLEDEISENGDDSSAFYKIDLSKLDIESTKRGLEEGSDITDVYFVAAGTFNVYYLKGEKIANEYYFSLSEKLTGKLKVANNQTLDTSNITVSSATGAIKLTKNTAEFTNSLTVEVKATLETGETMKYIIAGQEIAVATGATTIDVANIVSNSSTLKTAFYQSDANKYLTAKKYSGENLIAEAKLNISNLDILSGSMTSVTISYTGYNKFVLGKISGYTDLGGSGIKEAKVLYTTNQSGEAYYTNLPTTITKEYVKQVGKSFNATTLKLPIDIKTFALVFIDNAGNVSDVATFTSTYVLDNIEQALANGLKIGDKVTGYILDSSKSSTQTSGDENTAPDGTEVDITKTNTKQTVNQTAYSTWKYIGISENREILIAPDMPDDEDVTINTMKLSGKGGYRYGPEVLDTVCNALYGTDKGTATSMNMDDINRILNYTGSKGLYYDSSLNPVYTPDAKKIGDIVSEANYYQTPDGSSIYNYYSNGYDISKSSTKISATDAVKNFVYTSQDYWLATKFALFWRNDYITTFGTSYVGSSSTGSDNTFDSAGSSSARSHAVRPVVHLNSTVKLTKQSADSWKIS